MHCTHEQEPVHAISPSQRSWIDRPLGPSEAQHLIKLTWSVFYRQWVRSQSFYIQVCSTSWSRNRMIWGTVYSRWLFGSCWGFQGGWRDWARCVFREPTDLTEWSGRDDGYFRSSGGGIKSYDILAFEKESARGQIVRPFVIFICIYTICHFGW